MPIQEKQDGLRVKLAAFRRETELHCMALRIDRPERLCHSRQVLGRKMSIISTRLKFMTSSADLIKKNPVDAQ